MGSEMCIRDRSFENIENFSLTKTSFIAELCDQIAFSDGFHEYQIMNKLLARASIACADFGKA